MDRLFQWIYSIPPVTRYWSVAILLSSILTTLRVIGYINLVFIPDKAFTNQYWRLITSFCYFGDLSFELLLNTWVIVRSSRLLETSFMTKMSLFPSSISKLTPNQLEVLKRIVEKNKSIDYLYFILLICTSILTIVSYGYYKFDYKILKLGSLLDDILLYIWCRNNPNLEVSIFGLITIQTAYLPWCYTLLDWILSKSFVQVFLTLVRGGGGSSLSSIFKQQFFWRIIICFSLGHFWWFTREFLVTNMYYEVDEERRRTREETFEMYKIHRPNLIKNFLVGILLPPWYWIILRKIRTM